MLQYTSGSTAAPKGAMESAQYADFAYVQQQWFQAGGLSDQLAYWQRQLAGTPPALELPTDYPRPAAPILRGAHHFFSIGGDICAALEAFSRAQGVTQYMSLLSAFLILLRSRTDLFTETTIARMADQFHMLLRAIVEQPQASLADLIQLLAAADQRCQEERRSRLIERRKGK